MRTSRVAEIESGSSDVTLEIPYEEYDRLKAKPGLAGVCEPVSDIGMIFITNVEKEMLDENVRLAAIHAIDKEADRQASCCAATARRSTRWRRRATRPSIPRSRSPTIPRLAKKLLAASGYSPEKPVKFTIQTTRGFKPKDYEMIQAIVGMWRKVGIDAEYRGLRDRQALRAARRRTSWRRRRSTIGATRSAIPTDLDRLCDVLALAALGLEVARISTP